MRILPLIPAIAMAASLGACASQERDYRYAARTPLNGGEQQVLLGVRAGEKLPNGTYVAKADVPPSPVDHDLTLE